VELSEIMLREFWDERDGGFFFTGKSHEPLISRTKPIFDASIPSGNAMATQLLLRLHHLTGNDDYRTNAEKVLRSYYDAMESQPFGFAHMLCAMDSLLKGFKDVVVVGNPGDAGVQEMIAAINSLYLPNKVFQLATPDSPLAEISPLLEGKNQVDGRPTAYVCQNFTCSAPVTSASDLRDLLQ